MQEGEGVGLMTQQVKSALGTPVSCIGAPVQILATLLPIQLPANAHEKAADGPSAWALPLIWKAQIVSGSRFGPGPALAITGI